MQSTTPENTRRAKHGEVIVLYAANRNGDLIDDATDTISDVLHYVAAKLGRDEADNVLSWASQHFDAEWTGLE